MASLLVSRDPTPIAQLNPDLPDQAERVVRGEVTITWPYNSVTKTTAFLLAEPDVRLRRARGQVRIELHGPSAKEFSASGIGAGDEVLFSLDGAEWAKDESPGRIPGARLDWQLLFNQRLALQAKLNDSNEPKQIDVNHPQAELTIEPTFVEQPAPLEPELPIPQATPAVRKIVDYAASEYPSPAFMKRARISYGSLFEGGLDIFEEDGGVTGKGRKRSRFGGRDSSAWRYTSQSPSPEPEAPVQDETEHDIVMETERVPSPQPQPAVMTDEGCQTVEVEITPASTVLAETAQSVHPESTPSPRPAMEEQTTTPLADAAAQPSPEPTDTVKSAASSLFAISNPINTGLSMFGTASTVPVDRNLVIADQVRFGFSHRPQAPMSPLQPENDASEHHVTHSPQLDPHAPAKFADMESYVDAAEEEMETAENRGVSPQPPAVEEFDRGHWEMHTRPRHYNVTEGGHFGSNALIDGTRVGPEEPLLHSDGLPPVMVPEGFDSYGTQAHVVMSADDTETRSVGSAEHEARSSEYPPHPVEQESHLETAGFVENIETQDRSDDEIRVDEDGDGDGEYDEDDDQIEEGDYDQRNYNIPQDDDEGLSNEYEEMEQQAADRYGEEDVYDEDEEADFDDDGYGEDGYGEDEYGHSEGSYDSEEDYDEQSFHGPVVAASSKAPVVISLLSDSDDDDDEPPPKPSKPTVSASPVREEETPQEHLAENASKDVSAYDPSAGEAAAEISEDQDIDHRNGDDDTRNGNESQIEAGNGTAIPDNIAHTKSQPQALGKMYESTTSLPAGESPRAIGAGDADEERDSADHPESESEPQSVLADDEQRLEDEFINMVEQDSDREEDELRDEDEVDHESSHEGVEAEDSGGSDDEIEIMEVGDEEDDAGQEIDHPVSVVEDEDEADASHEIDHLGRITEEKEEDAGQEVDHRVGVVEDEDEEDSGLKVDHHPSGIAEEKEENASQEGDLTVDIVEEEATATPTQIDEATAVTPMQVDEAIPATPMQVDEGTATTPMQVDEGTATPMDVDEVSLPHQVESESTYPVTKNQEAEQEDIVMGDMPPPSPEGRFQAHPPRTYLGSPELGITDQTGFDDQIHEDTHEEPTTPTSGLIIQHEEHTHISISEGHDYASVDMSESAEVVSYNAPTDQSAIGPTSPPLTQPAEFELKSETSAQPSTKTPPLVSNKNERPLPLLTPSQSHINTQAVTHSPVVEQHIDFEFTSRAGSSTPRHISPSAEPEADDALHSLGHQSENTQQKSVSELPDVTFMEPVDSPEKAHRDELREHESANTNQVSDLPAIVEEDSTPRDGESIQPTTPPRLRESVDKATPPVEEHLPSVSDFDPGMEALKNSILGASSSSPPARHSRTTRSAKAPKMAKSHSTQDEITVSSPHSEDREQDQELSQDTESAHHQTLASSPDVSIHLARQSIAAKRSKKGPVEPLRTSPRITRARSNSLQMSVTSIEDDPNSSFTRASLASPSKQHSPTTTPPDHHTPPATTASLKAELTKGLRKLPECVSLKNIKSHVDKHPNIVAIVASNPTTPSRAKGGPREYMMSFNITDPSMAPNHVIEVQLYRPHKESLPIVKPGDAVLLEGFQVRSLSKKGFGLRTASESAWAVFEDGDGDADDGDGDGGGNEPPPQIKGPPVEDYEEYSPYMSTLKAWYRSLDGVARGKLEKAVKKFEEIGGGSQSQSQSQK